MVRCKTQMEAAPQGLKQVATCTRSGKWKMVPAPKHKRRREGRAPNALEKEKERNVLQSVGPSRTPHRATHMPTTNTYNRQSKNTH